ncbi:hypothetical protein [Pseudoduganella sp. R-43]|uniref:hypothetical protein n=1 Tax=unclassified Pseudoduganella TaxID=2637179 RepID=UPI003CF35268
MNLGEILENFEELGDDEVIFAEKPWNHSARAEIGHLDSECRVPESIRSIGLSYFLEVITAKEALEVFGDKPPTVEERSALLLFYAENDAFPDWVFER